MVNIMGHRGSATGVLVTINNVDPAEGFSDPEKARIRSAIRDGEEIFLTDTSGQPLTDSAGRQYHFRRNGRTLEDLTSGAATAAPATAAPTLPATINNQIALAILNAMTPAQFLALATAVRGNQEAMRSLTPFQQGALGTVINEQTATDMLATLRQNPDQLVALYSNERFRNAMVASLPPAVINQLTTAAATAAPAPAAPTAAAPAPAAPAAAAPAPAAAPEAPAAPTSSEGLRFNWGARAEYQHGFGFGLFGHNYDSVIGMAEFGGRYGRHFAFGGALGGGATNIFDAEYTGSFSGGETLTSVMHPSWLLRAELFVRGMLPAGRVNLTATLGVFGEVNGVSTPAGVLTTTGGTECPPAAGPGCTPTLPRTDYDGRTGVVNSRDSRLNPADGGTTLGVGPFARVGIFGQRPFGLPINAGGELGYGIRFGTTTPDGLYTFDNNAHVVTAGISVQAATTPAAPTDTNNGYTAVFENRIALNQPGALVVDINKAGVGNFEPGTTAEVRFTAGNTNTTVSLTAEQLQAYTDGKITLTADQQAAIRNALGTTTYPATATVTVTLVKAGETLATLRGDNISLTNGPRELSVFPNAPRPYGQEVALDRSSIKDESGNAITAWPSGANGTAWIETGDTANPWRQITLAPGGLTVSADIARAITPGAHNIVFMAGTTGPAADASDALAKLSLNFAERTAPEVGALDTAGNRGSIPVAGFGTLVTPTILAPTDVNNPANGKNTVLINVPAAGNNDPVSIGEFNLAAGATFPIRITTGFAGINNGEPIEANAVTITSATADHNVTVPAEFVRTQLTAGQSRAVTYYIQVPGINRWIPLTQPNSNLVTVPFAGPRITSATALSEPAVNNRDTTINWYRSHDILFTFNHQGATAANFANAEVHMFVPGTSGEIDFNLGNQNINWTGRAAIPRGPQMRNADNRTIPAGTPYIALNPRTLYNLVKANRNATRTGCNDRGEPRTGSTVLREFRPRFVITVPGSNPAQSFTIPNPLPSDPTHPVRIAGAR